MELANPADYSLEFIEICFRDQYFSRTDLHRLSIGLRETIAYFGERIDFPSNAKVQICELWKDGTKVFCGYVDKNTKIVFRSFSAVIHIFVQMSCEMWHVDEFQNLYWEKSISYLKDLIFRAWAENNCNHDVTLVLFTRVFLFFKSDSDPRKSNLCVDYLGRSYVDFFRVIVQNEHYSQDEWRRVMTTIKNAFASFRETLLDFLNSSFEGVTFQISNSCDGNYLETLNINMNLYEGYSVDRNFDRTGKCCHVISPGSGVFVVNRNLLSFTKERFLDCGVDIDLICLGTQPLHSVPLLIVFKNDHLDQNCPELHVPHWVHVSFYRTAQELSQCLDSHSALRVQMHKPDVNDKQVLSAHGKGTGRAVQQYISSREKDRRLKYMEMCTRKKSPPITQETVTVKESPEFEMHDGMSDASSSSSTRSTRSSFSVDDEQQSSTELRKLPGHRSMSVDIKADSVAALAGQVSTMARSMPHKNSSNLFHRSVQLKHLQVSKSQSIFGHMTAGAFALKLPSVWPDSRRVSADQRRWAHVKPRDSNGRMINQHHEIFSNQSVLPILKTIKPSYNLSRVWADYFEFLRTVRAGFVAGNNAKLARLSELQFHEICESHRLQVCQKLAKLSRTCSEVTREDKNYDLDKLLLPPSHPNQFVGVDWKSLTAPACLPLTTDYFPDKTELRRENYLSHENQVITERISPNEYLSDE
ncbi:GATOR complex protein depdc5 [Cichlidogyrus casuarinus]|uniref:GATOR complex protein depdc5 n=1 Tax=Cichlidogyrus casuarinus TaxID=1844966 RepID=A0ABD2PXJ8_9PLAT